MYLYRTQFESIFSSHKEVTVKYKLQGLNRKFRKHCASKYKVQKFLGSTFVLFLMVLICSPIFFFCVGQRESVLPKLLTIIVVISRNSVFIIHLNISSKFHYDWTVFLNMHLEKLLHNFCGWKNMCITVLTLNRFHYCRDLSEIVICEWALHYSSKGI